MRIAIVDTSQAECANLRHICTRWRANQSTQPSVETFSTAEAFLNAWHARQFDLVILDTELGGDCLGIKLAKTIREHSDDSAIVLTSLTPQRALEGYEISAAGYLLKLVSRTRLIDTLDRVAPTCLFAASSEPIRLSAQGLELLLEPHGIALVQSRNHYVDLLFSSGHEIRVRKSFSSLREALADLGPFFQSARGTLVNFTHVRAIDGNSFILFNGRSAPISRANLCEARLRYESFILAQAQFPQYSR